MATDTTVAIDKDHLSVLIVEDDEDDFFITRNLLSKARSISFDLDWAQSYEEGLESITTHEYDVCLVDYRLGAYNGLDLLREALERGLATPIILLTGQGDLEIDITAMQIGAADYLVKGQIDAQLLERSIRYARERKRADERIREQAQLLDKARDAISAMDMEGRIVYWNKSAERLTGWTLEEVEGRNIDSSLYGDTNEHLAEARQSVEAHGDWTGELLQRTKNGEEIIVESRWTLVRDGVGNPRSILTINTDITERKKLEAQFLRSQRMESIGRLVGGIAHDLGNLLVPILLGVRVLQQRFEGDEKTLRTLGMIQKSAQRGSDMVKQVLAFARGVEGERIPLSVQQIVKEVERIARETFPINIEIHTEVADDVWIVNGDSTQLQQVVMNLCVNARDAMPEGGKLYLRAENFIIDEHLAEMNIDARPGAFVKLAITDTGSGIPPETLDKIFEPFFTTKPVGKGTGLGLSTVYSIVKSHGGFVNVYSELDEGTTFFIYLPASQDAVINTIEESASQLCQGEGELILVVDDEEYILETTKDTLEGLGFRVLTAKDGTEALSIFAQHRDDVRIVLTDLMMPYMDGIATIRALKNMRPELPIIAASGMTGNKSREAVQVGAHVCLAKPFTAEKLCSVLNELLNRDGHAETA
ncbi:MAG TPA: response regulator [Rhodothermales bacterium]|nr:response regulator [Rhodothermales bacterium]